MQKKVFFLLYTFLLFNFQLSGQQYSKPKITDVLGKEKADISCGYPLNGNCLDLKVENFPTLYESTSYEVSSTPYLPAAPFNKGTPLNANADDSFINKIALPFNFCYFGNNYKEVVIGSNGVLTFDNAQVGNQNYPNVVNSNPSITLPHNSIFGVYNDMIFSRADESEIYYEIVGTAPLRKFVVSFYKGTIVGCDGLTSTSQIVLSEGSNVIEIFVESKPVPCNDAKFKKSLLGILNSDGTTGYSPENRNTGIWSAQREGWRFTPNGTPITPQISWFNSAKENVGTGEKISVCPDKNEIYTVKLTYPVCGNVPVVLEDDFPVTFAADFPVLKDYTKVFCSGSSMTVNLDDYRSNLTTQDITKFNFFYYEDENRTRLISQPQNYTINNQPVYVRAESKTNNTCSQTAILHLSLISTSLLTDTVILCDTNNDGIEKNVDLTTLDSQLFTLPVDGVLRYYLSSADAAANSNEVKRADLTVNTALFVKYESGTCSHVFGPIKIQFLKSPDVPPTVSFQLTTCDERRDFVEPFDFMANLGPLIMPRDSRAVLSFFEDEASAFSGAVSKLKTIHAGLYPIYVRIQIPGEICFSVATVNMVIAFTEVTAENAVQPVCYNGNPSVYSLNLEDYSPKMLKQSLAGITISYFATMNDAVNNVKPISNMQNVAINSSFISKAFYVRFTDSTGCYAVKTLEINLIKIDIKKEAVVCDVNLDGQEAIVLSSLDAQIIGSQQATVTYFLTEQDALDNTNVQTNYVVNSGNNTLYARVVSACSIVVEKINVTLGATPLINNNPSLPSATICDNNNDGKEPFDLTQFESKIYSGTDKFKFSYYTGYNPTTNTFTGFISNPTIFSVKGSTIVYARVANDGGCFSVSTLNLNINFKPVIVLEPKASLSKCDFEQDANESFYLPDALPQLFTASKNTYAFSDLEKTYYRTRADAESGLPAKQISSTFKTSVNGITTVWVRFTSNTEFCYSVAPIELLTAFPPKARNSEIKDLCDDNFDGIFEVDLTKYTEKMIFETNVKDFTFTFFRTKAEANNLSSKPISNPQAFTFPGTLTEIYVRVENAPGCFDVVPVKFAYGKRVTLKSNSFTVTNACDIGNNGIENINLTQFEKSAFSGAAIYEYYETLADLQAGKQITAPKSYSFNEKSGPKKILMKVTAPGFCAEKADINLTLKKTPMFTVADQFFCSEGSVDVQPDFSGLSITSFEWVDPTGKIVSTTKDLKGVKTAGVYKINVTAANGCTFSTTFTAKTFDVPTIKSVVLNGKIFTVDAVGNKPIIYSSDGINYQPGNTFNADNLPFGITAFYVKYADSACQGDSKNGLKLRNAFTPDADGINDTWIIDGLSLFKGEKLNLKVYNRYQEKIYEEESATKLEWDGKTLSRVVPTDSYWYVLTLPDGTVYTGWVLLKNRN